MNALGPACVGAELPANAVRTVIEHSWARCLSGGVTPRGHRAAANFQTKTSADSSTDSVM